MEIINSKSLQEIIKNKETFVIKFFTEGCPNCMIMSPHYEQISKNATIPFFKIDGEKELDELKEHGVMAFPTTIVFLKGKEKARFGGFMNFEQIDKFYSAAIENDKKILAKMEDLEKTAIQCGTISSIEVKDNKFYITFWDNSVREYSDIDPKHIKNMLEINGKSSVGSYYRTNIRPNYDYVEVKEATEDLVLNK